MTGTGREKPRRCARLDRPGLDRHISPALRTPFSMKQFLLQFLTWWNGQTLGTRFFTWRRGRFVGEDEFGNRYYRALGHRIDPNMGNERRWVIYNGDTDASKVPPGWRAWLCHNGDVPPSEEPYQPRDWERPHVPNLTGTPHAYRPRGSQLATGERPAATGDYVPWTPGE
jgi:NADH:ubiquinone oxidoreductase subunit